MHISPSVPLDLGRIKKHVFIQKMHTAAVCRGVTLAVLLSFAASQFPIFDKSKIVFK